MNSKFFEVKLQKKGGETMKKIFLLTALVVLFAAPAAMAAGFIKTSRHNLGSTGDFGYKSSTTTQICIYCHTPHNATKNVPLWNRNNPVGATFALYTASPTLNMLSKPTDLGTNSISRFCMSCHDAVTATNLGAGRVQNTAGETVTITAGANNLAGKASLGTNLTNDHPVGFRYDDAYDSRDLTIKDRTAGPANTANGAFKFFRGDDGNTDYMECATCHEVHGKENPNSAGNMIAKFLRKPNDSSSLCLTCHDK